MLGNSEAPKLSDTKDSMYKVEVQVSLLMNPQYYSFLQSLKDHQRDSFQLVLKWCRETTQSRRMKTYIWVNSQMHVQLGL